MSTLNSNIDVPDGFILYCAKCGFCAAGPFLSSRCISCGYVTHASEVISSNFIKIDRESIKTLLYDLGLRGLTPKQKEVMEKFCNDINKNI